jgi:hypothetical protein
MNNPTLHSSRLTQLRFFSHLIITVLFFGCNAAETPLVESEAVRAPSGGQYQRYTWRTMDAELLHPSAQPDGENIFLVLPLPELTGPAPSGAKMAFVQVNDGQHALHPADKAENKTTALRCVVENGIALDDRSEQMHFFVVLEFTSDHAGQLFVTQKQYSLRQLGQDMAHFGVQNAVAVPLTTRGGWYRYANAPFELRKGRLEAAQLFTLKQQAQP